MKILNMKATVVGWCLLVCLLNSLCSVLVVAAESPAEEQIAFFEQRIRPVLVEHCYSCHSEGAKKQKGGLWLDSRQSSRKGGDSGPAVVPGKLDESLLIEAIRYESLEMPPSGKLPQRVITDFETWVKMGAADPRDGKPAIQPDTMIDGRDHWAFQPIEDPLRPKVSAQNWPLTDIDYFILNRLEGANLKPAADADRYTWLRRVSLDLTGLPPTIAEIRSFQEDASPDAYETVVERLLSSRAFGERWARHWLDLVGYADQIGTSNNVYAEHAWKYRDYVITALNDDKPYDRFIREQIAGDLLPYESVAERAANLTATGFLVLADMEIVEADKAKLRVDVIDQQVRKVGKAFLGMTLGCARCHDHKFDPIPQRDYYAMAGFFHSTESLYKTDRGVWSDVVAVELPETEAQRVERAKRSQQHAEMIDSWKLERTQVETKKDELEKQLSTAAEADPSRATLTKERDELAGKIDRLNRQIEHAEFFAPTVPRTYGVRDLEEPSDMRITVRGNPRTLADSVPRGFLSVISRTSAAAVPQRESGRKELATWIASANNPLTARVAVNRIWQKIFGKGLSPSVDYFGLRGETPSHPQLLDHLATRFIRAGWSQKQLIRTLVLSHTYRMSSDHNEQAHTVSPDNRLLWRMNRRRMDAESLRDSLLAVSGKLQTSMGGPALALEFVENVGNIDPKNVNPPSFNLSKWRPEQAVQRTIYLPIIRSGPQPGEGELRNVFDFLQPAEFAGQRAVTAVPTQALFLMNSPVLKTHASHLAERLQKESAESTEQLELLWLVTLNRPMTTDEKNDAEAFLAATGEAGWVELCHAMLASNEFLIRL